MHCIGSTGGLQPRSQGFRPPPSVRARSDRSRLPYQVRVRPPLPPSGRGCRVKSHRYRSLPEAVSCPGPSPGRMAPVPDLVRHLSAHGLRSVRPLPPVLGVLLHPVPLLPPRRVVGRLRVGSTSPGGWVCPLVFPGSDLLGVGKRRGTLRDPTPRDPPSVLVPSSPATQYLRHPLPAGEEHPRGRRESRDDHGKGHTCNPVTRHEGGTPERTGSRVGRV